MVCKSQKCDKGNHHQFLNIIIQKYNFSFPDFCLSCGRAIRLSGVRRNQSGTVTGASSSCSEGHKTKHVSMLVSLAKYIGVFEIWQLSKFCVCGSTYELIL